MVASIDNFILLRAMRFGAVAALMLLGSVLTIVFKLSRFKTDDKAKDQYRRGLLIVIGGLCISLTTVDLWSATHSYFWFLLGSGIWIFNKSSLEGEPPIPVSEKAVSQFSSERV